jgi:DNA-binding Lrp family transcriptional regulator
MNSLRVANVDENERKMLAELRKNARTSLLALARQLNMPASTVHDKVRRYNGSIVIKHTTLLDFGKLGYSRALFAIKANPSGRDRLQAYLASHWGMNNLHKINSGYDFLAEYIGRDQKEIEDFAAALTNLPEVIEMQRFVIIDDVTRERFMPTGGNHDKT